MTLISQLTRAGITAREVFKNDDQGNRVPDGCLGYTKHGRKFHIENADELGYFHLKIFPDELEPNDMLSCYCMFKTARKVIEQN